jgi:hypothetical protein
VRERGGSGDREAKCREAKEAKETSKFCFCKNNKRIIIMRN